MLEKFTVAMRLAAGTMVMAPQEVHDETGSFSNMVAELVLVRAAG